MFSKFKDFKENKLRILFSKFDFLKFPLESEQGLSRNVKILEISRCWMFGFSIFNWRTFVENLVLLPVQFNGIWETWEMETLQC
jgi:hypothetical protein